MKLIVTILLLLFSYTIAVICPSGQFLSTNKLECNTCPLGWSAESSDVTSCTNCIGNQYQDNETNYGCKNCPSGKQILSKLSFGLLGDEKCVDILTETDCQQGLPNCCTERTHLCETKPCFLSIDGTQSVKDVEKLRTNFHTVVLHTLTLVKANKFMSGIKLV